MVFFKKRGPPDNKNVTPAKRVKEASQPIELNPYPRKIIVSSSFHPVVPAEV